MPTSRRDVLTGAASLAAGTALAPANTMAKPREELLETLKNLVGEICQRSDETRDGCLLNDTIALLGPALERRGKIAIGKSIVDTAIDAIELLYRGDDGDVLYPYLRNAAGHVATRIKWATGKMKPPLRWDPDL